MGIYLLRCLRQPGTALPRPGDLQRVTRSRCAPRPRPPVQATGRRLGTARRKAASWCRTSTAGLDGVAARLGQAAAHRRRAAQGAAAHEQPRARRLGRGPGQVRAGHRAGRSRTARPISACPRACRCSSRRWTPTGVAVQTMRTLTYVHARPDALLRRLPRAPRAAPPAGQPALAAARAPSQAHARPRRLLAAALRPAGPAGARPALRRAATARRQGRRSGASSTSPPPTPTKPARLRRRGPEEAGLRARPLAARPGHAPPTASSGNCSPQAGGHKDVKLDADSLRPPGHLDGHLRPAPGPFQRRTGRPCTASRQGSVLTFDTSRVPLPIIAGFEAIDACRASVAGPGFGHNACLPTGFAAL